MLFLFFSCRTLIDSVWYIHAPQSTKKNVPPRVITGHKSAGRSHMPRGAIPCHAMPPQATRKHTPKRGSSAEVRKHRAGGCTCRATFPPSPLLLLLLLRYLRGGVVWAWAWAWCFLFWCVYGSLLRSRAWLCRVVGVRSRPLWAWGGGECAASASVLLLFFFCGGV